MKTIEIKHEPLNIYETIAKCPQSKHCPYHWRPYQTIVHLLEEQLQLFSTTCITFQIISKPSQLTIQTLIIKDMN